MSTLLPAKRRAERFAALVDATSTTGADEPYAPLLEVVGTLRAAADEGPAPRADYVADLRSRLMAEADTALVPTDARLVLPQRHPTTRKQQPVHRRRGRSGAGRVGRRHRGRGPEQRAGRRPLPAQARPGARRPRGSASPTPAADVTCSARPPPGWARSTRCSSATPPTPRWPRRCAASPAAPVTAPTSCSAAYQRDGDDGDIASVRDFAGTEMGVLTDLSATAPRSLQSDFAEAAQLLSDLDQQATVLCGDCGPRGPLELPARLRPVSAESALVDLLGATPPDTGSTPATGAASGTTSATASRPATPSPGRRRRRQVRRPVSTADTGRSRCRGWRTSWRRRRTRLVGRHVHLERPRVGPVVRPRGWNPADAQRARLRPAERRRRDGPGEEGPRVGHRPAHALISGRRPTTAA